ncbi:MAG: 4-(cytidine 5'-diphospho)-2-C-methyl-D-erythritol kinase, partial [Erysipelotrichaceae bacterium]|nr:4-(cytidine 5'-diphospho)-2-C-methyl-D-erythritol kinase [Erysipelotrichaceae bacterium]
MDRKAYAKINLSLDVVGLRKDGYHELDMLMVPLTDLYDVVSISESIQDSFSVNIPIPWDERNLVFKALELFRTTYNIDKYYEITLEKHIPEQAGLGGGSSDAAVTLQLLYELNGITVSHQEKIDLGKKLGADVPFFLFNRPARVQGIGEKLRYVDFPGGYKTMLIKPEGGISTQEAFRLLDSMSYEHVSIDGIEEAFRKGEIPGLCNSLEYSAVSLLPQIGELKQQCIDAGYTNTLMSGSGSTVFVLVPEETDLTEFSDRMKSEGHKVYESRIMWRAMPQLKTERLLLR